MRKPKHMKKRRPDLQITISVIQTIIALITLIITAIKN